MADTSFAEITDEQFRELLRLVHLYFEEASKCRAAKAYLAGCVMAGASLEASLLALVRCLPDEASRCPVLPRASGKVKRLLSWDLADALRVAKNLNWLPASLALEDDWCDRAQVGDCAEVLRMMRNLVHPARYLKARGARPRIADEHLVLSFEVLRAASIHMLKRVTDALAQEG